MAQTRREEARLLSEDERELVAQTHHPVIKDLGHSELGDLLVRLRDRRDRARDISRQQRREMRGKARPAGAARAADNTGSHAKSQFLAAAVKRLNKEIQRRRSVDAESR
jgi:hypothetical protein